MTASATIRAATSDDARDLTRLLTDAFLAGQLADHLVPSLPHRQRIYPAYWSIIVAHALDPDTSALVEVTDDGHAAAIWYPTLAGQLPDLAPVDYDTRLAAATGPYLERFVELDHVMHQALPILHTDWAYLGFLATHPTAQSEGRGAALLESHHQRLDATRTPGFLIASTGRSRRLYARHGYLDHGDPIRAGRGVLMYPMLRPARP
ncbi:GNAT family N-acetyltransferase [Actinocatenispora rupis]|uniref:N-acetyltransferase domain-containing protein n=1 Tax=Actinocatenispora rupis TaxID=519421 RepID=A0A8J3JH97_9ACTN|nr:GNAT family N-acetyltransferase [Actinocatenispora rupis]GID14898.1 hypothetical protein Aru02nite_57870 [Actinocatenispora rupis]